MNVTAYYQKVRETEAELANPCVVVSETTADGGKAGVRIEVPRRVGARMIVDGVARAATEQESREFQEEKAEAKRAADQLAAANRMQVTVIPTSDLRSLRGTGKGRE
jgi:hypothetical protein